MQTRPWPTPSLLGVIVVLPLLSLLLVPVPGRAAHRPQPAAQPVGLTAEALRQGGYVIVFRHGVADQGSDAPDVVLDDCSTQRNLGPQGLQDARLIGQEFRLQRIPVGQVLSSEFCRAWETATIAFRRAQPEMGLNFCISTDGGATCSDQRPLTQEMRTKYLERALTTMPTSGNTVLVTHGVGIIADLQMGEAAIYQPDGMGGFVRVARVLPSEWMSGVYPAGGMR